MRSVRLRERRHRQFWWLFLLLPLPICGQLLPAGTTFQARLSTATGSSISHRGDELEAVIISPICLRDWIVIPIGTRIHGTVESAIQLRLGLRNKSASLAYKFDRLELPDGGELPIQTQLVRVESARERVDYNGVISGVRPLANLSSTSLFYTLPLLVLNPAVGIPVWGVKALVAPSTRAEIYFPQGTEITLSLSSPLETSPFPRTPSRITALSGNDMARICPDLGNSLQRRARAGTRASDVVNLLFVGTRQEIDNAFQAAGWSVAEGKSPLTLYRMYSALTRRKGYRKAPMNRLTLNGKFSDFAYQKGSDTVAQRHHVRFWKQSSAKDVWLGAATEDVALRFRPMHWTHLIDPAIDKERAKVVNDLAFTGCLEAAGLLAFDSDIGGSIKTDNNVAIVRFNQCALPTRMVGVDTRTRWRAKPVLARLGTSFRDDLIRSNPLFTTVNTLRFFDFKPRLIPKKQGVTEEAAPTGLNWVSRETREAMSAVEGQSVIPTNSKTSCQGLYSDVR